MQFGTSFWYHVIIRPFFGSFTRLMLVTEVTHSVKISKSSFSLDLDVFEVFLVKKKKKKSSY